MNPFGISITAISLFSSASTMIVKGKDSVVTVGKIFSELTRTAHYPQPQFGPWFSILFLLEELVAIQNHLSLFVG